MKNSNSTFLVCFSLWIFFLMLFNHANAGNITDPRRNVNLSPFVRWRSAYYCMLNQSGTCKEGKANYTISLDGLLIVGDSEINDFCTRGCYEHTLNVFKCIQDVKRDFIFKTKAPLSYVNNVTVNACSALKGFNTTYRDPNSATSLCGRFYVPLVSTVMTMAFLATFGV